MGQRDQDYVLSGIVELDDAYFGAPKSNGKRGRGTAKTSALASVPPTEQGHRLISNVKSFLLGMVAFSDHAAIIALCAMMAAKI